MPSDRRRCRWLPRRRRGISPEEKTHLRSKLSALIPQDDNQVGGGAQWLR
jgi:hypothetical protein